MASAGFLNLVVNVLRISVIAVLLTVARSDDRRTPELRQRKWSRTGVRGSPT
jgi:hypothetical protein